MRLSIRMLAAARTLFIVIALWCITTGLAYDPTIGDVPSTMAFIVEIVHPRLWSSLWIAAGVLMILGLRWYRARQVGVSLAMGLTVMLASVYVSAWLSGAMARGWVSAKNYLLIAAVVAVGAAILAEGVLAGGSNHRSDRQG